VFTVVVRARIANAWLRWLTGATAVAMIVVGCASEESAGDSIDLAKLDVGSFPTTPRAVPGRPSAQEATLLEGIRMADAVADSSQFESSLVYGWRADPIPDAASLVPLLGEAGKGVLDQHGWLAGYRAGFADRPPPADGAPPQPFVGLSITLLRFPNDDAARAAAAALEATNWKDLGKTIAVPLPKHPDVTARYTPGNGAVLADTAIGPFVVHLMVDAPPAGVETHVGDFDPLVDAQRKLLQGFRPTPVEAMPALPRDPDGLLSRMVSTDPAHPTPVSAKFAVYGPTGALHFQPPTFRKDKLYEKWGVDRLAVSGTQNLYRLGDHKSALEMLAEFTAEASRREHEIDADPSVPDERCFQTNNSPSNAFVCRIVFENFYTSLRADTAISAKQKSAAQYALLAASK
jgi:hypothetical protein